MSATSVDNYRIPKEQVRVSISLPPRPPEDRLVFLSSFAETHQGPETVSDLLAHARRFLPVARATGGIELVRKDAIRWVNIEGPERAEWRFRELCVGAPSERIRCEFPDAEVIEGIVHALTPCGEQRMLDVVNLNGGFLHLEVSHGLYLVNLDHVCSIAIVEETDACS